MGLPDRGELILPIDVERDDAGNTYVVDALARLGPQVRRRQQPVLSWGSFGTGPGEFGLPFAIGVNEATGEVYVADVDESSRDRSGSSASTRTGTPSASSAASGPPRASSTGWCSGSPSTPGPATSIVAENDRVQRFSSTGQFELMWGKDVVPGGGTGPETCVAGCKEGEGGTAEGELGGAGRDRDRRQLRSSSARAATARLALQRDHRRLSAHGRPRRRSGRGDGRRDLRRGLPGGLRGTGPGELDEPRGTRRQRRLRAPVHRRPGQRPGPALERQRSPTRPSSAPPAPATASSRRRRG